MKKAAFLCGFQVKTVKIPAQNRKFIIFIIFIIFSARSCQNRIKDAKLQE
jgi:hypothetical protein